MLSQGLAKAASFFRREVNPPALQNSYIVTLGEGDGPAAYANAIDDDLTDPDGWFSYVVGAVSINATIVKLNGNGDVVWQNTVANAQFNDVTVMGDYIYAVGVATILGANVGNYMVKYDRDGVIQFQKTWSTDNDLSPEEWTHIENDGTYLYTSGWFDLAGTNPSVVAKVNSSGVTQWIKKVDTSNTQAVGVAVSATHVYLATVGNVIFKIDLTGALVQQIHFDDAGFTFALSSMSYDGSHLLFTGTIDRAGFPFTPVAWMGRFTEVFVQDFVASNASNNSGGSIDLTYAAKLGSEYMVGGWSLNDSFDGRTSGILLTKDNVGAAAAVQPEIKMEFDTPSGSTDTKWEDGMYDGTNILMCGSFAGSGGNFTGIVLLNNDNKVSMTGSANSPLDDFDFTVPSLPATVAHTTDVTVQTLSDVSGSVTEATESQTAAAGALSVVNATF